MLSAIGTRLIAVRAELDREAMICSMGNAVVPVVDLRSPNAADDLDTACRSIGFFQVAGHAIRPLVLDGMRAATADFFAQPLEDKRRWAPSSPEINRGYAAKGSEGLSYSVGLEQPPDLFEAFNVGPDDIDRSAYWAEQVHFAPNLWPDRPADLRSAVVTYFSEVRALAHQLTTLFAAALHLPSDFFADKTDHSTDTLRINHYERRAGEPDALAGQMGMGAHTDYGILTVLYADAVPGLQILTPGGRWIDVVPEPDCLLVNLGDLTATWTNDHWRSTLHRVTPPPPGTRRRSAAFFHDGNYDALVECLPTCTSADDPPRYAPVSAGEHLLAKLLGPRTLSASNARVDTTGGRLNPGR